MNPLTFLFGVMLLILVVFIVWMYTPSGKRWLDSMKEKDYRVSGPNTTVFGFGYYCVGFPAQ